MSYPTKYRDTHPGTLLAKIGKGDRNPWTDEQIAKLFGTTSRTVQRWRENHPEFMAACDEIKADVDDRMEASLFERGMGYSHPDVKIFLVDETIEEVVDGQIRTTKTKKVLKVPFIKHYPPDTLACFGWLKNRRPEVWRDRHEVDHNVHVTLNDAAIALGVARYEPTAITGRN